MSTPIIGAGAAALGFYVWLRRWQQCGYAGVLDELPVETHARTEQPPTSWSETLYLFKEALRYMYQETLGRWHAIDLFFGLAYLSRRAIDEYPAADIAAAGHALHGQHMQPAAAQELMYQLQEVRRYMLYCQGLKHHKPELQLKHWRITTGLEPHDVIKHSPTAGLLRPAYVIFRDTQSQTIILCVRGTHSRSDMFTSLTGTVKPHHALTPEGVALGYSHLGMLAAARWLLGQTKSCLIQALEEHPGYQLRVVGHSMGGGTAAMLTMMMREKVPQLSAATAWAIACPACMTLDLAASCAPFVTTVVHGTDIVPTFSSGAIDRLRHEVTQSSWFAEFQGDVQQRLAANFGASVRALRLGPAGEWTQRNIISTAATSFKSCYSRAPRSCYTRRSRASAMAAAACADHASRPVSPHAAAAPQHRSSWGFHLLSRHGRHQHQQQQQHADGAGSSSLQAGQQDGAFGAAADQEGASLLGGSSSQPQQPLRVLPFGWMRSMGRRSSRPGYAAAASSNSGRHNSSGGAAGGVGPPNAEVALVESALQACLMAADSGQLGPGATAAAAAAAGSGGGLMGRQAVPPAGAFSASSGTAAGRGAALANDFVKAASKVVLRTKRPAAPGKKDDDETSQPPLQQSRFDPSRQQHPALQPPAAAGAGSPQLPVSTGANTGSVHAPSGAPAAAAGGPTSMDVIEAAGSSGGTSDPAAAASSAGKPLPTSLRSRKGWAWGGVLGAGPGNQGWVESDNSSRRSSLAGGRRVVEYLGHTVGQTGRLMVETTGHLLKSSSNVLFQACTAPMPHPAAAAAAAAAAAGLGSSGQDPSSAGAGCSSSGGGGDGIVVPPSSTGVMERGGDADGSFVAALAASLAAEEEEDGASDSDSDPDLQEGPEGDEGDSAFSLLDQPALRGNISALVAAVSSDTASAGQGLARVQQEEEQAAERLLQDLGPSVSEANVQLLAVQSQQQHQQQQRPPVAPAAAPGSSQQQQQASSAAGRTSPLPDALRRESPMPPVPGVDRATTPASAREAGGSQAAEAGGSGDGGGGGSSSRDRAAERLARRRTYPAGRVLHLMPKLACPVDSAASSEPVPSINPDAAAAADGGSRGRDAQQQGDPRKLPPLTAAQGSVGLGDEYVLLEVPDAGVYGRVKLCPSMVRDHFIPSYLKALDSVLGQLQQVVAAGPGNGAAPPPHGGGQQE